MKGLHTFDEVINEATGEPSKESNLRQPKVTWSVGRDFARDMEPVLNQHYDKEFIEDILGDKEPKKRKWFGVGDYWFNFQNGKKVGRGIRFITADASRQIQFNWLKGNYNDENWDNVDIASSDGIFSFRIQRSDIKLKDDNGKVIKTGKEVPNNIASMLVLRELNRPMFGKDKIEFEDDIQVDSLNESYNGIIEEARGKIDFGKANADRQARAVKSAENENKKLKQKIEKLEKAVITVKHAPRSATSALDDILSDMDTVENIAKALENKFNKYEKGSREQRLLRRVTKEYLNSTNKKTTDLEDTDLEIIEKIFEANQESVETQMKRFITALELMFGADNRGKKYCTIVSGDGGLGKSYLIEEFMDILKEKEIVDMPRVTVTGSMSVPAFLDNVRNNDNSLFIFDDANKDTLPLKGTPDYPELLKNGLNSGTPYRCMTRDNKLYQKLYALEEVYMIKNKDTNNKWMQTSKDEEGSKLFVRRVAPLYPRIKTKDDTDLGIEDEDLLDSEDFSDIDVTFRGKDDKEKYEYFTRHMKRHYFFKNHGVQLINGQKISDLKEVWGAPFRGYVVIITNVHQSEFDDPILQRSYVVPVYSDPARTMEHNKYIADAMKKQKGEDKTTNPQWINRYGHIAFTGGLRKKVKLSDEKMQEIFEVLKKKSMALGIPASKRVFDTISEYASLPHVDWKKYADILLIQEHI